MLHILYDPTNIPWPACVDLVLPPVVVCLLHHGRLPPSTCNRLLAAESAESFSVPDGPHTACVATYSVIGCFQH